MRQTLLFVFLFLSSAVIAQDWESVAPMPFGKHHPVTFSLNGFGYAITGTQGVFTPTRDVFQYNPETNEWTTLSQFPGAARSFAIGKAYNGKGYLGFGASTSAYFNDIWEYDPTTEQWTPLTTCPCSGRRHPAMIIKNEKIYVGLGDDANGDLGDWYVYDMVNDSWTQAPNIPGDDRHHPFQFDAGNDVYAGMGHSGSVIYKDWYRFDVTTNQWEEMGEFPGEARVAGTQFGWQGKGYVLSGDGDDHSFMQQGEFWEYDSEFDEWTQLPSHPGISRWAPGSFVIDGAVYFLAGQNRQNGAILNDMWKYQLAPPSNVGQTIVSSNMSIFPNPAINEINISSNKVIQQVRLLSIFGQEILVSNSPTIDVSQLASGMYVVEITDIQNTLSKQKIKVM